MALAKSYALIRALNRPRHPALLWVLGAALYGVVILTTGRPALAGEARRLVIDQRVKEAMRFAHWTLKRGWPGITLFDDSAFQFSGDINATTRQELMEFTRQRAMRKPGWEASLDVMDVVAREGHAALRERRLGDFEGAVQVFTEWADEALSRLAYILPAMPSDARATSAFSITDARAALEDFHQLMLGWPRWYAISGTFLGIVREKGWLPHDYDIDVGVHAEEVNFDDLRRLYENSNQFSIGSVQHQDVITFEEGMPAVASLPVMIKLVHRTGINIDVFVHHLEGDNRWHGSAVHRWGNREFDLVPYQIDGLEVLGPKDFECYLSENYGAGWRVPVKAFNGTTDTPNLEVAPNLMSIAVMLRKACLLGGSGAERGRAVLRLMERQGFLTKDTNWRLRRPLEATLHRSSMDTPASDYQ